MDYESSPEGQRAQKLHDWINKNEEQNNHRQKELEKQMKDWQKAVHTRFNSLLECDGYIRKSSRANGK